MAALTTAAIVGAAVVGAAATVHTVNQQKKAATQQKKAIKEQETRALEAMKVSETRESSDAKVRLGRADEEAALASSAVSPGRGAKSNRTGSVASRVGGLSSSMRKRASVGIGL